MDQLEAQEQSIRLERDADYPSKEVLVGIGDDEIEISGRITTAVLDCRRIFSYVVDRVAENRMRTAHPDFRRTPSAPPSPELLAQKGMVRDELLKQIGSASLFRA